MNGEVDYLRGFGLLAGWLLLLAVSWGVLLALVWAGIRLGGLL